MTTGLKLAHAVTSSVVRVFALDSEERITDEFDLSGKITMLAATRFMSASAIVLLDSDGRYIKLK